MSSIGPLPIDRWAHERDFWSRGLQMVAGVDEVGRGPLAGPVVAVAAILSPDFEDPGVGDSKAMTAVQRMNLFPRISQAAMAWGVGVVDATDIDRINILQASFLAMRRALDDLPTTADAVLVDGKAHIPRLPLPQRAIVAGDRLSPSIGAASILAKEVRDRIMEELDQQYPGYGFAKHKGYATPMHTDALRRLGPTPIHRRSFAPLRLGLQSSFDLSSTEQFNAS